MSRSTGWRCGAWFAAALMIIIVLPISAALAQDDPLNELNWQHGNCTARFKNIASLPLPEGYMWLSGKDMRDLLEMMGNPLSGGEVGIVAPEAFEWFVVFEFDDCGYVKDEDRDKLDERALLKSIREGTAEANKERRRRGWDPIELVGWEQPPRYDHITNDLVWAIRGRSSDGDSINYDRRRLGRRGVMSITLVLAPEQMEDVVPVFDDLMQGYRFNHGHGYAEYRPGDKIAKYGLAALITGGAAAVAVKAGVFKWLWKVIVGAAVVIGGAFKAIFGRRRAAA